MNIIKRNITLNKKRILRRIKDRKSKNTRRKKLHIRSGGDTSALSKQSLNDIPMQNINSTDNVFLGKPDDVRTESVIPEPAPVPQEQPFESEQETSFPLTTDADSIPETGTTPPATISNLEQPPAEDISRLDEQPVISAEPAPAPLDPIEEQTLPETVTMPTTDIEPDFDVSNIPPPTMMIDDVNEPSTETDTTSAQDDKSEEPTTIQQQPKDKKFVLVRVSIPDGNTMDIQGNNETTLEETVRQLKVDTSKTDINDNSQIGELKARIDGLEKLITDLNNKFGALVKQGEPLTPPTDTLNIEDIPPPKLEQLNSNISPTQLDKEQPDEDDLTAFSELDD